MEKSAGHDVSCGPDVSEPQIFWKQLALPPSWRGTDISCKAQKEWLHNWNESMQVGVLDQTG